MARRARTAEATTGEPETVGPAVDAVIERARTTMGGDIFDEQARLREQERQAVQTAQPAEPTREPGEASPFPAPGSILPRMAKTTTAIPSLSSGTRGQRESADGPPPTRYAAVSTRTLVHLAGRHCLHEPPGSALIPLLIVAIPHWLGHARSVSRCVGPTHANCRVRYRSTTLA